MASESKTYDPLLITTGALAIAGNIAGVLLLRDIPTAYRIGQLDEWVQAVVSHPKAAAASAIAFSAGLTALAAWSLLYREQFRSRVACTGAALIAAGSIANAAGSLAPLVLALHVRAADSNTGRALLGSAQAVDAFFNLTLGVGLVALGAAPKNQSPGWLRGLAIAAGVLSLPVSGQIVSDTAAKLLAVAGPAWLAFIAAASFARVRPE